MSKFKITRYKTEQDGILLKDVLEVSDALKDDVFAMTEFKFYTRDLPDLIKALQDKEKEITK